MGHPRLVGVRAAKIERPGSLRIRAGFFLDYFEYGIKGHKCLQGDFHIWEFIFVIRAGSREQGVGSRKQKQVRAGFLGIPCPNCRDMGHPRIVGRLAKGNGKSNNCNCKGYRRSFALLRMTLLAFVVSHPCGRKKPQGWGTEFLGEEKEQGLCEGRG